MNDVGGGDGDVRYTGPARYREAVCTLEEESSDRFVRARREAGDSRWRRDDEITLEVERVMGGWRRAGR